MHEIRPHAHQQPLRPKLLLGRACRHLLRRMVHELQRPGIDTGELSTPERTFIVKRNMAVTCKRDQIGVLRKVLRKTVARSGLISASALGMDMLHIKERPARRNRRFFALEEALHRRKIFGAVPSQKI